METVTIQKAKNAAFSADC